MVSTVVDVMPVEDSLTMLGGPGSGGSLDMRELILQEKDTREELSQQDVQPEITAVVTTVQDSSGMGTVVPLTARNMED